VKISEVMLDVAKCISQLSKCDRRKHACVLVDRNLRIVATGYNGPASGLKNNCMRPEEHGNCGCVHAEANACIQPRASDPFFAFLTGAPCEQCAQMLINAGVRMVVYAGETTAGEAGLRLLHLVGVGCFHRDMVVDAMFKLR